MAQPDNDNYRQTFFALRFAMLMLVGLLALSVIVQVVTTSLGCVQHSISAYYHTSAQMVFVGTLCAIGVCLIIYRARSDIENRVLDCSGFLALLIALMPTGVDTTCGAEDNSDSSDIFPFIVNNLISVAGTAIIALLLTWAKYRIQASGRERNTKRWWFAIALLAGVGVSPLLFWFDDFPKIGHGISASLFFVGLFVVVVVNAFNITFKPRFRIGETNKRYAPIAYLMLGTAVIVGLSGFVFPHFLIVLEGLLILEFAWYWNRQTDDLRTAGSEENTSTHI